MSSLALAFEQAGATKQLATANRPPGQPTATCTCRAANDKCPTPLDKQGPRTDALSPQPTGALYPQLVPYTPNWRPKPPTGATNA